MIREEVVQLSGCLRSKELKPKFLTSVSYVGLLALRRKMDSYLIEMSEDEKKAAEDHEVFNDEDFFKNKDFQLKLKEIQKKEFDETGIINFIEEAEFDKFVRKTDIDFDSCYVLEKWLLKP